MTTRLVIRGGFVLCLDQIIGTQPVADVLVEDRPDVGVRVGDDDYGVIAVLNSPDVADRHSIQFTINDFTISDNHPLAAPRLTAETVDHRSERTTA